MIDLEKNVAAAATNCSFDMLAFLTAQALEHQRSVEYAYPSRTFDSSRAHAALQMCQENMRAIINVVKAMK